MRVNANEWVLNSPWTPIECAWIPMSEWEQPLNTHWVHMTTIEWVWTPNECAWPPLCHYWMQLTGVWPWERSHLCQNWTRPERLWVHLNACEWVLHTPWMLVSAGEGQWVSIEDPLNTHWVRTNANEWVGTAPEHPLSAHECLWVSNSKVWIRTSRVVNLTNLEGGFKSRVWKLALINDIVLWVRVRRKTCTNFSDCRQDTFGTLILYRSVTVYFDVQQNCLELQK
jgi:hypothetical protein